MFSKKSANLDYLRRGHSLSFPLNATCEIVHMRIPDEWRFRA